MSELSMRAEKMLATFLQTLKSEYRYPKTVISAKIEEGLGLSGSEVRAMVNTLRRKEHPIGSNTHGYYYANNERELRETIQHLTERRNSISAVITGLELAFKTDNQGRIF